MPVLNLDQLCQRAPDWSPVTAGELMSLSAGEAVAPRFSDGAEVYVVLQGRVAVTEGGARSEAAAGTVVLMAPGVVHSLEAMEGARVLRLRGELLPPFREGLQAEGAESTVALPPAIALQAPIRDGVAILIDASRTFSPAFLGTDIGPALLLKIDIASTPKNLVLELRKHWLEESRQMVGVILPPQTEKEMAAFIAAPDRAGLAFSLHPALLGIDADLADEEGRASAKAMRRLWSSRLFVAGIRPCVRMPLRAWNERELFDIFRELARIAPRRFGIVLTVDQAPAVSAVRLRRMLSAIMPWVAAVEYERRDSADQVLTMLDRLGFQGYFLRAL